MLLKKPWFTDYPMKTGPTGDVQADLSLRRAWGGGGRGGGVGALMSEDKFSYFVVLFFC